MFQLGELAVDGAGCAPTPSAVLSILYYLLGGCGLDPGCVLRYYLLRKINMRHFLKIHSAVLDSDCCMHNFRMATHDR